MFISLATTWKSLMTLPVRRRALEWELVNRVLGSLLMINRSLTEVNEVLSVVGVCIELLGLDSLIVLIKDSLVFVLLLTEEGWLNMEFLKIIL